MRSKGKDENLGEEGWLWHIQELEEAKCKINSRIMNQECKWNFIQNLAKLIILNNSFCRPVLVNWGQGKFLDKFWWVNF